MVNLALIYQRESFALDPDKAATLFRTAADRGHPVAQYRYALILNDAGCGDWNSAVQVFSYFKLSAEQGFTGAQINVGYAYEHGKGVEADLEEAAHWYGLGAAAGNADVTECLARFTKSPFMRFSEVMWPKITEADPTTSSGAVSKMIASLWHKMDDATKAAFVRSEGAESVARFFEMPRDLDSD